jgi:V/A-type H+-transporting ATPase subunit D
MSARLKVPPTKSSLLHLKNQVDFLQQGHDMLERKRDLLTRLVYERLHQYRKMRLQTRETLDRAYRWLGIAHLRMGEALLKQAGLALEPGIDVRILPRSHIGVEYPSVETHKFPLQPVGLMWTDASFDEARRQLLELAALLAHQGEAETALWRLLAEQRKTQKRVNALKYNVIPRYQATIRFIEGALEEEERNNLFQVKLLREQKQKKRSGQAAL